MINGGKASNQITLLHQFFIVYAFTREAFLQKNERFDLLVPLTIQTTFVENEFG